MIEEDTKHKKWATKETKAKSDHKHSYVSYWAWFRCKDQVEYRFLLKPRCKVCDYEPRRVKDRDKVTEVEVSQDWYHELRNNK